MNAVEFNETTWLTAAMQTSGTPVEETAAHARHWAPKLKALADENRLTIALLLSDREYSVKDLQDVTGLSQTLVSHHLKLLHDQGLTRRRVDGRCNHYSLCCGELTTVIDALTAAGSTPC